MSRPGNVWDNAAMESFFSSLKTERIGTKIHRARAQAKANLFDYIECLYNRPGVTRPWVTSVLSTSNVKLGEPE